MTDGDSASERQESSGNFRHLGYVSYAEHLERYDLVVQAAGTERASRLRRLLEPDGTLIQLSGDSPNRWFGPLGRIVAGRLHLGEVGRQGQVIAA